MRFDFFDLRLFVAIAESGSVTQGAKTMNIVPAAASTRIKHLEEAVRSQLFFRESTGMRLTPPGHAMLHHVRQMLEQADQMRMELAEFGRGVKGILRIGSISIGASEYLPRVLGEYLAAHPFVNVEIRERMSDQILYDLRERAIDVGIIGGELNAAGLEVFPYQREQLVALVPNAHALARLNSVPFEQAIEYDYVGLNESNTLNTFLGRKVRELGRMFKTRALVRGSTEVGRMVEAGVGIGIMEASAARPFALTGRATAVPLANDWSVRQLCICVRALDKLPPYARKLVEHLQAGTGAAR